jgi:hypothetical protein
MVPEFAFMVMQRKATGFAQEPGGLQGTIACRFCLRLGFFEVFDDRRRFRNGAALS